MFVLWFLLCWLFALLAAALLFLYLPLYEHLSTKYVRDTYMHFYALMG